MQGAEAKLEEAVASVMKAWAKWTITLRMILAAAQATKSPAGELKLDRHWQMSNLRAWQSCYGLSCIVCQLIGKLILYEVCINW